MFNYVILGHSILPHDHVEKKYVAHEIRAAKNLSVADIIKLALAHNLGENHLQDFKNCNQLVLTQAKDINEFAVYTQEFTYKNIAVHSVKEKEDPPKKIHSINYLLRIAALRAPPTQA